MAFALYTAAIGLSAFLLFLVQPLITKLLLPVFGGGASIWITSLVFFQVVLLLGYGLTHLLIQTLGIRRHMIVLALALAGSLAVLPLGATTIDVMPDSPAVRLLTLLALSVGLPYLVLSTTSPTLQYWMAHDDRMARVNPYVQYGVSNGGSLVGLLAYPFVAEPLLRNSAQASLWTGLYVGYALLLIAAMAMFLRTNRVANIEPNLGDLRLKWFLQALVPSALLLVTTHYLTLDVVNLPLLWIAPLSIYLITFVICFLFPTASQPGTARTSIAVLAILLLMATSRPELEFGLSWRIASALACLFIVCMVFHGDLERSKPATRSLTGYYLVIATGGAAGSILTGLIAPLVFNSTFEFSLIVLAALVYVVVSAPNFSPLLRRVVPVLAVLAAVVAWIANETNLDGQTITRERSFYGTYAVRDNDGVRRLVAGTHVHGEQFRDDEREHIPIAYYHDQTGVADLFRLLEPRRVAFVGLGIGSLIEFGTANTHFDIYELDPAVIRIARKYFTVIPESPSSITYFPGDARIRMRDTTNLYNLIVMDAFTSGSIPTHLVTLEAVQEMLPRLTGNGAIAYHISNHHLDLLPVLAAISDGLGLELRLHESVSRDSLHMYPARWVVLTKGPGLTATLDELGGWQPADSRRTLWLDESSNIWSVLK